MFDPAANSSRKRTSANAAYRPETDGCHYFIWGEIVRRPPSHLYDQVLDLALAITNASEAGDPVAEANARNVLIDFYRSQTTAGVADPFLTEAVADYETDPNSAVGLYRLAIEQAASFAGEPVFTKQLSLAERMIELGKVEEAGRLIADARADALNAQDDYHVGYADELRARILNSAKSSL